MNPLFRNNPPNQAPLYYGEKGYEVLPPPVTDQVTEALHTTIVKTASSIRLQFCYLPYLMCKCTYSVKRLIIVLCGDLETVTTSWEKSLLECAPRE